MANIEEQLENGISELFEERNDIPEDHLKDRIAHDKNIIEMAKVYQGFKKIESDESITETKIEHERTIKEAELNHDEKWKAAEHNEKVHEFNKEVELKQEEMAVNEKASKRKLILGCTGIGVSAFLHLLARRDSQEGIIPNDRLPVFDKFFNLTTKFIK